MAHSKSAKKRIRQSEDRRVRNRSVKSALRSALKKFAAAVESGNAETAAAAYQAIQKKLDKTASKGILRKGTVSRVKSRLSRRLKSIKKA